MNAIEELLRSAGKLAYDPEKEVLYADGEAVGAKKHLTREVMLARLDDPKAHLGDSDEKLFDLLVEKRMGLRSLLVRFLLYGAVAFAINIEPYRNFIAAGGTLEADVLQSPGLLTPELARATAIFYGSLLVGFTILIFGLAWTGFKAWRPLAMALGVGVAVNGVLSLLISYGVKVFGVPFAHLWWLFAVTIPLGVVGLLLGLFLSLKDNFVLLTVVRLAGATIFCVLITILFPVIMLVASIYLHFNRKNLTFADVWKHSPELYNFLIVNIFPISFHVIHKFREILRNGKIEKKRYKKGGPPLHHCWLDVSKLKVGDVLLTGQESWNHAVPIQASNILSNGEKYRYWSHAAIYSGNGKVIEAQTNKEDKARNGVIETVLADYFFVHGHKIMVLRHRYLGEAELTKVVEYCRRKLDSKCVYDTWGVSFYALASLIPPMLSEFLESEFADKFFNVADAYFCSELVAEAFQETGKSEVGRKGHRVFQCQPWRVKPLDFAHNPLFDEVTDVGYQQWKVTDSPPIFQGNRSAASALLATAARVVTGRRVTTQTPVGNRNGNGNGNRDQLVAAVEKFRDWESKQGAALMQSGE